jgi:hypothetical protein
MTLRFTVVYRSFVFCLLTWTLELPWSVDKDISNLGVIVDHRVLDSSVSSKSTDFDIN